ncbi:MAG: alpha/beta fold hydrolase [Proteobacteria bacterium]|jgi:polyhydroxyalkanoate synthase subunit PhaC|nr:alpha/beta fold hydrolase [Pseudomonadota bacterium]
MRGVRLIEEEQVDEVIHLDRCERLQRQKLELPAANGQPPLGLFRTTAATGPTKRAVILVHGFAQNHFTWRISRRSLAGYLASEGYEVLNLDLRGHGLSRELGAGNATDFSEYVDDVSRIAMRCDQPPFAIGHSLGGAVIVGAATQTPLAGVVHLAGVFAFATQNRTLRALARTSLKFAPVLTASRVRVSTGWAGSLIGQLYSLTDIFGYGLPLAGWVPGSMEKDLLQERLALGFDWTSVEVWLQMCRWARGEPFQYGPAFSKLDLPLFVIVGDHDALASETDGRACFDASGCDDKEITVFDAFEHQVHWGHIDLILGDKAPGLVWPRIADWMNRRC